MRKTFPNGLLDGGITKGLEKDWDCLERYLDSIEEKREAGER